MATVREFLNALRKFNEKVLSTLREVNGAIVAFWKQLLAARISIFCILAGLAVLRLDAGQAVVLAFVADVQGKLGSGIDQPDLFAILGAVINSRQALVFVFACVWSGLNAWYWPHLLLRYQRNDCPVWFVWLTAVLGGLPALGAAAVLVWLPGVAAYLGWVIFAPLGLGLVLLLGFVSPIVRWSPRIGRLIDHPSRFVGQRARNRNGMPLGGKAIEDVFTIASLLVGLVLLVIMAIPSIGVGISQYLGAAGVAFLSIGLIISGTSFLAYMCGQARINLALAAVCAFLVTSYCIDRHAVRTLDTAAARIGGAASRPPDRYPGIDQALTIWSEKNPTGPLILVAAAGGASRAGYWASAVLRALDERTECAFGQHVFAMSSVSGGSLGTMAFAAFTAEHPPHRNADGTKIRCSALFDKRLDFDRTFVGKDYLSPAVGSMLFPDLIGQFLPLPASIPDRAAALEIAWEQGWATSHKAVFGSAGHGLDSDFSTIWQHGLHTPADPWVPLALINGTSVDTGRRIITAPVSLSLGRDVIAPEDAYDFFQLVDRPIRGSTAILNGARFPLVSPAATLSGHCRRFGAMVDGGYFDNGGIETVRDLITLVRRNPNTKGRAIIVVEIDDDPDGSGDWAPDRNAPDLDRHPALGDPHAADPLLTGPLPDHGQGMGSEMTAILNAFFNARSAHGVLAAKRLSGATSEFVPVSGNSAQFQQLLRLTFNLDHLGRDPIAMSWQLSPGSRDLIDVALDAQDVNGKKVPDWALAAKARLSSAYGQGVLPNPIVAQRAALRTMANCLDLSPKPGVIHTIPGPVARSIGVQSGDHCPIHENETPQVVKIKG